MSLPVGFVVTESSTGDDKTSFGLGDLQLWTSQEVVPKNTLLRRRVSLRPQIGFVFPTGHYQKQSAFSTTEVEPGASGQLDLVTYNMRATLGAGTFSLGLGARFEARFANRGVVAASQTTLVPLTETPDDLRWGADATSGVEIGASLANGRWLLSGGVDHRVHQKDRVAVTDSAAIVTKRRAGGLQEIGVSAGLSFRIRKVACALEGRVPVWQKAGGPQLVETVSVNTGCTVAIDLSSKSERETIVAER
ncbi:MAG: hypothetical protein R3A47_07580 [Polyangiales bacterium]